MRRPWGRRERTPPEFAELGLYNDALYRGEDPGPPEHQARMAELQRRYDIWAQAVFVKEIMGRRVRWWDRWWPGRGIIASQPAQLHEVVPRAPERCPSCQARVGTSFTAVYDGTPEDKRVAGWTCGHCGGRHEVTPPRWPGASRAPSAADEGGT